MKTYEKPKCEVIELRNEENIAAVANNCHTTWVNNSNAGNQHCYKSSGS